MIWSSSTATVSSFCRVRIIVARLAAIIHVHRFVGFEFVCAWDTDERSCNCRPPAGSGHNSSNPVVSSPLPVSAVFLHTHLNSLQYMAT